jgi:NAD(P)-dependent dehydrogenase (short-subunit alcohol dehydrogenase family)
MKRRVTAEGLEATLAVNHLAPFLLTNLLLERLRAAAPARRLEGTGVVANAAHPGGVDTGLWRRTEGYQRVAAALMRPFLATPERGAAGIVMLAAGPEGASVTGRYFSKGRPARPSAPARDADAAARLWAVSETLTIDQPTDQGGAR